MYDYIYFQIAFWELLFLIDYEVAVSAHSLPCKHCKQKLNWNNYPRKPRGIPPEVEHLCNFRFCLCCSKCNKRITPPTVRFLGRKVYIAVFIIFIFLAEAEGAHQKMIEQLPQTFAKITFRRWFSWWDFVVPFSPVWKKIVGLLPANIENKFLPIFLMQQFNQKHSDLKKAVPSMLKLISPITVPIDYPDASHEFHHNLWDPKFAQKMLLQNIKDPPYIKRSD